MSQKNQLACVGIAGGDDAVPILDPRQGVFKALIKDFRVWRHFWVFVGPLLKAWLSGVKIITFSFVIMIFFIQKHSVAMFTA